MCKPVKDGGYKNAYDKNGNVKFSLTTLETYWPAHLKKMSENDMGMCACKKCQNMDDLHATTVSKRRKTIVEYEAKLEEMGENSRETRLIKQERETLEKELAEYKESTFVVEDDKITRPLHEKGWDACEQYGCGERRSIDGHSYRFLPWRCKKGDCARCKEKGYAPPAFESRQDLQDEMIKYSIFESKARCTVLGHGAHHIQKFDGSNGRKGTWMEKEA